MVKAVIMAGGEGTRLRPLTVNRPKPMIPVANKPLMEHIIYLLKKHGFREIGVTLYYLPETIMRYFGDGGRWGVKLYYSIESDKPLGTAGGVKNLIDQYGWDDTVVVISGDLFTDIDLSKMISFHRSRGSHFTIALRKVDDPTRYGIALLNEEHRVTRFLEKPRWNQVFSDLANMGIYVIEPSVFEKIPSGVEYDFAHHLIPRLIRDGDPVYGFRGDQYYWSDIGDFDQYFEANKDILTGKIKLDKEILGREISSGVYIGRDVEIDDYNCLSPPVIIGDETKIEKEVEIAPYTVIGLHNIVKEKARIERSIIWSHNYIGYSARVIGSIIADHVQVGEHSTIMEGSVISDETRIGKGAIVKQGVKIWPSKIIEPYTTVSMNIKWGIKWYKSLVDPWGITGLVNVEITPELATRIGMSIGTLIPRRGSVAVARDTYVSSYMIKQSIISGLLSTGVRVVDLGVSPLPVLTSYIQSRRIKLGVMINTLAYDPGRIRIKVFDSMHGFLSREDVSRLENIFFKEAYRKVLGYEVVDIEEPSDHYRAYLELIEDYMELDRLANARFLIDCCHGASSRLWNILVKRYGLTVYQANCVETIFSTPRREPLIHQSIDSATKVVPTLKLLAGFIFDSDGDKVVVVDDRGGIVGVDKLIALMAKIMVETRGRGRIVVPHSLSPNIIDYIKDLGGEVVMAEQGLTGLTEHLGGDVLIAADERGGITYPWIHRGSDAVVTTLYILSYLVENKVPLSQLIEDIPESKMIRERIIVPFEKRGVFMRLLYEELREKEVDTLDGIKVVEEDLGWGYIRLVPNEPVVEIMAESDTLDKADKLARILKELASKILSRV